MPVLVIAAVIVLVVASVAGLLALRAGRQLEDASADHHGAPVAPRGSVAARLDASLERTRTAVEELVLPEPDEHDLTTSTAARRDRGQTYTVVGAALLGLGLAVLIGLLLLV